MCVCVCSSLPFSSYPSIFCNSTLRKGTVEIHEENEKDLLKVATNNVSKRKKKGMGDMPKQESNHKAT